MNAFLIVPPVISFVISFSLAALVLIRDYRRTTHRVFATFLMGSGLWGLIIFAFRVSPDVEHAKTWIRILAPFNALTCVAFLHFSFLHTRTRAPRWLPFAIYTFPILVSGIALKGLAVAGVTTDAYGYLPIYTTYNQFISAFCWLFLFIGLVNFVLAYRHSASFVERNSYLYFLAGIGFSVAGGAVDYLSILNLHIPPLGLIGNIMFGILASVAVLKYQLLDMRLVLRKSIAYFLTSTVVAVPYAGVLLLANFYLQNNLPIWGHVILLLALALGLQIAWQRVQNLVDRFFYRERYDFLRELEQFSQEAHDISNLGELGSSLVNLISRAFQTASVNLLLTTDGANLRTVSSTGAVKPITFQKRSLLLQWFGRNKGILLRRELELDPQLQSLTARERSDIDDMSVELFAPLKTKSGELVGLLLMGPKRSEQPYSEEDMRRILTVTSRMTVELENARLYAQEMASRLELQHQNEQKTEFLHHVAHELKTPLTAVISSSELMTADDIVNIPLQQRERLLNNINRSAWLMDKKVSELLDLARIQIGRVELKIEPLDVSAVIEDLISQLSSLFKNKEQSVETQVQADLPRARADKERTTEVILNLLSNANKFTPAGGHVLILASANDDMVQVEVKDSAPIINDADRARIFDPYYRGGTQEDQQRVSGLGLGLAISKSLVVMQKGEIGVASEEGRGNTFFFTLPVWHDEEREALE